jgi:phosphohistidine phosphatase
MHLYFLRHGIAEERQPGLRDADRRLTPEGVEQMQKVALGLAALDIKIDTLFTSPLPRALETAQIAAPAVGIAPEAIRVHDKLAAGALRMKSLNSLLEGQSRNAQIMLVGHEPDFSMVVGQLVGGTAIDLKKAGLVRVEIDRPESGSGVLRWLLTPDHLMLASR